MHPIGRAVGAFFFGFVPALVLAAWLLLRYIDHASQAARSSPSPGHLMAGAELIVLGPLALLLALGVGFVSARKLTGPVPAAMGYVAATGLVLFLGVWWAQAANERERDVAQAQVRTETNRLQGDQNRRAFEAWARQAEAAAPPLLGPWWPQGARLEVDISGWANSRQRRTPFAILRYAVPEPASRFRARVGDEPAWRAPTTEYPFWFLAEARRPGDGARVQVVVRDGAGGTARVDVTALD
jgi:hypothetical protein